MLSSTDRTHIVVEAFVHGIDTHALTHFVVTAVSENVQQPHKVSALYCRCSTLCPSRAVERRTSTSQILPFRITGLLSVGPSRCPSYGAVDVLIIPVCHS
eukprot:TRINITY_DN108110_c0_g1_i3.p1 TRINITY_DN108110_c0_g1~~TRINITY_DN108110_c0_g1_i3.p1  ORF type:complete len:100 (+),score=1.19 TRINITY_DN108110_c0_g1_i3:44-343(+)